MAKFEEKNVASPVVKRLNEKIHFAPKRLSIWLNWHCRHLPAKAIMMLLIAFITICSSYFLWLIISAIN